MKGFRANMILACTRPRVLLVSIIVIVSIAVSAFQGCRKSTRKPNILLISLDTCRADYLGCYGKRGAGTRHLDALASHSCLFTNVVSPVPMTLPAHCSMLTGTVPPVHGVHDNFHYRLGDSMTTLAERLRLSGYKTAAAVGSVVMDDRYGLAQGFDIYDDDMDADMKIAGGHAERRGQEVTDFAVAWLENTGDEPFFLFLHYYDPHFPYRPPGQFASIFAADPYAGEIAYTDNCVGGVIETLKRLGLYDSTLIVVTSDHGEGRGEHGERLHGFYLYHSTTKVPLIIKRPGTRQAKRIERTVGLIDVTPTIVALAGLPVPDGMQGVDLSPLMDGKSLDTPKRYFYGESLTPTKYGCTSLLALQTDKWKYIQSARPELYDVENDPAELNNLLEREPQRVRTMRNRLKDSVYGWLSQAQEADTVVPDRSMIEKMKSLGYAGGSVSTAFEFDTNALDPKDFLPILEKIEAVKRNKNAKNYVKARELAGAILAEHGDVADVYSLLGQMAFFENKIEEAIQHYTEAVRIRPDAPDWHIDLGLFLARVRRFDEAIAHYRTAIGLILGPDNSPDELTPDALDANRRSPLLPQAYLNLGYALKSLGRLLDAASAFEVALRLEPDNESARKALQNIPHRP